MLDIYKLDKLEQGSDDYAASIKSSARKTAMLTLQNDGCQVAIRNHCLQAYDNIINDMSTKE